MIAFASNSLLCRAALKENTIDPATFTFVRIFSGAAALWLVMKMRMWLIVERTATPSADCSETRVRFPSPPSSPKGRGDPFSLREKVRMRVLDWKDGGNWISAVALFAYAAGFSFAYTSLSAGTGALLLFGAVQATMILWGLHKGERLTTIQIVGFVAAVTGLIVLVFPGLSAPPIIGSILMLGAGVAWGIYSLRGKGEKNPASATTGNFVRAAVGGCSQHHFLCASTSRSSWSQLRHNLWGDHVRTWLRDLVQRATQPERCQRRNRPTQCPGSGRDWRNLVARRTDHVALRARVRCCVRRNRARCSSSPFTRSSCFPFRIIAIMMSVS